MIRSSDMLKERERGERDFLLVDVREPNEFEINRIPGSVLIPKGEFLNGEALGELPGDRRWSSTARPASAPRRRWRSSRAPATPTPCTSVAAWSAWVNQVDPSQPSY